MKPGYDMRECRIADVEPLVVAHHGYGSVSASATYAFAVFENDRPVAGFLWQPPPPGAARSVSPQSPSGVLALSRMVAVPRETRSLNHVSKPLRRQMRTLIDRGRWPALVTYSDEGQGHTGHVYKCSGWRATTRAQRPFFEDSEGRRVSSYSNGAHGLRGAIKSGVTTIQRWEHWACKPSEALLWMREHGWRRVRVVGKTWRSGNQAFTWVQEQPRTFL